MLGNVKALLARSAAATVDVKIFILSSAVEFVITRHCKSLNVKYRLPLFKFHLVIQSHYNHMEYFQYAMTLSFMRPLWHVVNQGAEQMTKKIYIDGESHVVEDGENLAAVLLRQATPLFRTHPVDGLPRAAFCMMGVCFECLVEVNGVADQQACLIKVEDGMQVRRPLS